MTDTLNQTRRDSGADHYWREKIEMGPCAGPSAVLFVAIICALIFV